MKKVLASIIQAAAGNVISRAILRIGVRLLIPRQAVGAVAAVVNGEGKVLLARHAYRTDFPWGLPGGLVESGENPAAAVVREVAEELNLIVAVEELLVCDIVPAVRRSIAPRHLGLAYRCSVIGGELRLSREILEVQWIDGPDVPFEVAPFQARAIAAALRQFR